MLSEKTNDEIWHSGSGVTTAFHDICHEITKKLDTNIKVFIGSDSDVSSQQITFCKSICVYGLDTCAFYFFSRSKKDAKYFPNLVSRITEEARLSIELAEKLTTIHNVPLNKIEVHLDISPIEKGTRTSKFAEMLKGYVVGAGYSCKIKPNAWASQSIADRHSK